MPPPSRQFPTPLNQRVSLKLTFAFPSDSPLAFDELLCQLVVDGQPAPAYGSGVYVLRSRWDAGRQQAQGPTREARLVNTYLSEIRADHWAILLTLKRAG
ncbi:hypothetical protein GCM10027299_42420 [Larkinella ripae]